jgi:hypothetical protein
MAPIALRNPEDLPNRFRKIRGDPHLFVLSQRILGVSAAPREVTADRVADLVS